MLENTELINRLRRAKTEMQEIDWTLHTLITEETNAWERAQLIAARIKVESGVNGIRYLLAMTREYAEGTASD